MMNKTNEERAREWELKLWRLVEFSTAFREHQYAGKPAQDRILEAAKKKGYPKGLVRFLGAPERHSGMDAAAIERVNEWRIKIGLGDIEL